jgi:uncharacterized membrane protein
MFRYFMYINDQPSEVEQLHVIDSVKPQHKLVCLILEHMHHMSKWSTTILVSFVIWSVKTSALYWSRKLHWKAMVHFDADGVSMLIDSEIAITSMKSLIYCQFF